MWVWFLLIAPVERMLVFLDRRHYALDGSDAAVLRGLTLVPAALWGALFLVGTVAALAYGAGLLLHVRG